ncbi:NERD domain-containing protein [Nocardia sp. NPDC058058]|uniref:NERD domain-containing protein n=1 Tax=Nocardia sp. NPDC058058 TaxID=3346317 RepID=UPI0036DAD4F2
MDHTRWTAVTESAFEHERRGLDRIRESLPDRAPWRAWSNFTFATRSGTLFEVDLLLAAPSGVHLIELKSWRGAIDEWHGVWVQHTEDGSRIPHGNPMTLAIHKGAALRHLLLTTGESPYFRPSICFTNDSLRVNLPRLDLRHTHKVPDLIRMLSRPTHNARDIMTADRVAALEESIELTGITSSTANCGDLHSLVNRLFTELADGS